LFDQIRPRDINLELGIGTESGSLTYHRFNEPALNTFDPELAREREKQRPGEWHLVETLEVPIRPLSQVLEAYLPKDTKISFLTIDTEGFELQVLKSNDWEKFRPEFILSETFLEKIDEVTETQEYRLLVSEGYGLIGKTHRTLFFRDKRADANQQKS
jgi:FkbM family methyltransferase